MIKVNVGLSRKLTRGYNSTGYSVSVEGEVIGSLDDPEALLEKIREYHDLADEAIRDQIERYESESAIASRDEEPDQVAVPASPPTRRGLPEPSTNGRSRGEAEPATNKQVQFLLTLARRKGMNKGMLEGHIAGIFGAAIDVYALTKRQAGQVIEDLNHEAPPKSRRA